MASGMSGGLSSGGGSGSSDHFTLRIALCDLLERLKRSDAMCKYLEHSRNELAKELIRVKHENEIIIQENSRMAASLESVIHHHHNHHNRNLHHHQHPNHHSHPTHLSNNSNSPKVNSQLSSDGNDMIHHHNHQDDHKTATDTTDATHGGKRCASEPTTDMNSENWEEITNQLLHQLRKEVDVMREVQIQSQSQLLSHISTSAAANATAVETNHSPAPHPDDPTDESQEVQPDVSSPDDEPLINDNQEELETSAHPDNNSDGPKDVSNQELLAPEVPSDNKLTVFYENFIRKLIEDYDRVTKQLKVANDKLSKLKIKTLVKHTKHLNINSPSDTSDQIIYRIHSNNFNKNRHHFTSSSQQQQLPVQSSPPSTSSTSASTVSVSSHPLSKSYNFQDSSILSKRHNGQQPKE